MEDIASEVVRQLRAKDGDLDVWVYFKLGYHGNGVINKIQPTVQGGVLRWRCYDEKCSLLFDDVDDLLLFLETEKDLEYEYNMRQFEICYKDKENADKEEQLWTCCVGEGREKAKQFFARCSKIELY